MYGGCIMADVRSGRRPLRMKGTVQDGHERKNHCSARGVLMAKRWFAANGQRLLCAVCQENDARVSGRCQACMNYMRRHGYDRPAGEKPRRVHPRRFKPQPKPPPPVEEPAAYPPALQDRLVSLHRELRAPDAKLIRHGDRAQTLTLAEYRSLSERDRVALLRDEYWSLPRKGPTQDTST